MYADDLRTRYGGMMSLADVGEELGLGDKPTRKWLEGITAIDINGRKRYRVMDVAGKLYRNTEI